MKAAEGSRIYLLAVGGSGRARQLPLNPLNYRAVLRALFVALDAWVRDGVEPPASRVPTIADGTLVARARGATVASTPASGEPVQNLHGAGAAGGR